MKNTRPPSTAGLIFWLSVCALLFGWQWGSGWLLLAGIALPVLGLLIWVVDTITR